MYVDDQVLSYSALLISQLPIHGDLISIHGNFNIFDKKYLKKISGCKYNNRDETPSSFTLQYYSIHLTILDFPNHNSSFLIFHPPKSSLSSTRIFIDSTQGIPKPKRQGSLRYCFIAITYSVMTMIDVILSANIQIGDRLCA